MVKAHTPINWENEPSYNTPLNAANLNKMDSEIGILDDRIIAQDTSKLDKSTANTMVKDVTFNESTGIFTITLLNGSTKTLDTKLEKIATNFRYDYSTQKLILTLVDGTTQEIDMSALLTQYEFTDSATIDFSVGSDGKITATIKNGSITENMLQPNYLAEIKVESAKAETNAIKSQSYAVGGTSSRQNEDIDNARYYYEQAKSISESFSGALVPMGTVAFEDLPSLEDAVAGWMYNISNEFVTTDDFKEGAGHTIPLGANIFKTVDNFWDLLSGGSSDLIVDTVEGVNPTVDNSTDSNLVYLKNSGYTKQDGTPTPDVPIEIKGLGDSGTIGVKTCGKNLLKNTATTKTSGGVTFTVNEDGTITLNGTATADIDYDFNWNIDATKKSVLASIHKISGSVSSDSDISFLAYDSRWLGAFGPTIGNIEKKLEKYAFTTFRIQVKKDTVCTNLKVGLMVRYETITDGTYEPYTETQASIPVSSPLYDGDYIEVFADGSGEIVRNMKSVVYDGSDDEAWYHVFYGSDFFFISTGGQAKRNEVAFLRNSHFTPGFIYEHGYTQVDTNRNICVFISSFGSNVADWKNWLKSNHMTVVYKLETPTTESLTAEQVAEFKKLQTFKGVTHINADGEVTVRYYCNNDSGDTVGMLQNIANNSVSKSSIANNLTTTTEGMVLDATQGKALDDKISTLNYSLENRLSKSLVSKETINIDSLPLSGGGHSTITSEEISKPGYTLVGANFFLRGSYAENIIASFTIGGSSTKLYNFAFYNPSDYNISAYGYVDLIYVANSL